MFSYGNITSIPIFLEILHNFGNFVRINDSDILNKSNNILLCLKFNKNIKLQDKQKLFSFLLESIGNPLRYFRMLADIDEINYDDPTSTNHILEMFYEELHLATNVLKTVRACLRQAPALHQRQLFWRMVSLPVPSCNLSLIANGCLNKYRIRRQWQTTWRRSPDVG
jgi:hypothetical protein